MLRFIQGLKYENYSSNNPIYQQCTVGDCNTDKPGMMDMKGKAKWEAWNGKKGMSASDADAAYISHVAALTSKYN